MQYSYNKIKSGTMKYTKYLQKYFNKPNIFCFKKLNKCKLNSFHRKYYIDVKK